jgi:hypothetical protein
VVSTGDSQDRYFRRPLSFLEEPVVSTRKEKRRKKLHRTEKKKKKEHREPTKKPTKIIFHVFVPAQPRFESDVPANQVKVEN